jgi:hypothetical protein
MTEKGHEHAGLDAGNVRIQIFPIRIEFLDQSDFPSPIPFFYSLFTLDRILGIIELFEVNQLCDIVSLGKAWSRSRLVFEDAPDQIVSYAYIERPADAASEDIDVVAASPH